MEAQQGFNVAMTNNRDTAANIKNRRKK